MAFSDFATFLCTQIVYGHSFWTKTAYVNKEIGIDKKELLEKVSNADA